MEQYFADLEIGLNTRPAKDKLMPPVISLRVLLESLAPGGKTEGIPPALVADLFRAALTPAPYPYSILPRAVERMRAEIGRDGWIDSYRRDARCALIKAVLNRLSRRDSRRYSFPEVLPTMDPTNHQRGYLLGRLLAVIERLQQGALGDVNASVIDRYFAGASATPAVVFKRLEKAAPHYVKKMRESDHEKDRNLAPFLDHLRSNIVFHLRDGYPRHLSIDEQGLFILGYHHQRHWLWLPQKKREEWITERGYDQSSVNVIL
ncbi:MAG TPA: type I-C CRISPR-associated protein Cas8c/Csd1 [Rhizomicrobium sp.]|nr:type I-C CRISPR-associated protein Cas8c/Csd1 [Rhizomicrobium sp.]